MGGGKEKVIKGRMGQVEGLESKGTGILRGGAIGGRGEEEKEKRVGAEKREI